MFASFLPSFSRDEAMRVIPVENVRQVAIRALVEEDGDSEVRLILVTAAFYGATVASMIWWLFTRTSLRAPDSALISEAALRTAWRR